MTKSNKLEFFSLDPWVCFFFFLVSNSLISYFPLSTKTQIWIGSIGLGIPFAFALWRGKGRKGRIPIDQMEFLPGLPLGGWILLGVLAIFFRFYRLTTLSIWPNGDESNYIFYIFHLMRFGFDRFFFASSLVPPAYPAWMCLSFKIWGPSLLNLWFWPAFFSALAWFLVYGAARRHFSGSFSLVCALLMASCFWVYYSARFCPCTHLIPLAEIWVLGWMGELFREGPRKKRLVAAVVLGLSLALTFYAVYLHWISVTLAVLPTVLWKTRKDQDLRNAFVLAFLTALLPFVYFASRSGFPPYVGFLSSAPQNQFLSALSYFRPIFWGLPIDYYSYQPVWGGFLNPILGSLFFIGLIQALKNIRNARYAWLTAAFFFFLLPGMLTQDMETYRILPVLGALIPLVALGTARLLVDFSPRKAAWVLLLLFLPSAGLDFYHLAGPYHRLWDSPQYWIHSVKSLNNYRASLILRKIAQEQGPGLVFQEFTPNNSDRTLALVTFPFDAVANWDLSFEETQWAAVLVNVHYQPFLKERFKGGKAYGLTKDLAPSDGGRMLWVFPLNDSNRPVIRRWYEADRALDDFLDQSQQNIDYFWGKPSENILQALQKAYPAFHGDPFLESCFWEKISDTYIKDRLYPEAIAALRQAVSKGYPAAHLFNRLGVLELIQNKPDEARNYFQKAVASSLDLTDSRAMLQKLGK